ncbi:2440_t:CDS:1, partial [Racocetra persica]
SMFNKKPIYNSPTNKYQEFTNAYVYSIMVRMSNHAPDRASVCREAANEWNNVKKKNIEEINEIIRNYMATPLNLYDIQTIKYKRSVPATESCPPPLPTVNSVDPLSEIPANASAQKKAADEIMIAEKKLKEFEQIYNITTDIQVRNDIYPKIENLQAEIKTNKDKII